METWVDDRLVYEGRLISVRAGTVRLSTGEVVAREVVRHPGGVAVVALFESHVLLVRQFRIAVGRDMLELPAGKLENGETPEMCANRELLEETGYRAGQLIPLMTYFSSVGFTNEQMSIYLAVDSIRSEGTLEWDERIETVRVPLDSLENGLHEGGFEDAKTLIGLYALLAYLRRHTADGAEERGRESD